MSSFLRSKRVEGKGSEEVRTWAGVVGGELHSMDSQPLGHLDPGLVPLDDDDDDDFLNSLFDDILNDPLAMEPGNSKVQLTDGLDSLHSNDLLTYLSNSHFRKVISDCNVLDRQIDTRGIRDLMERTMVELTSQDIDCAKVMMKDTLQSYSEVDQRVKSKRLKKRDDRYQAEKTLLDASSPSVLDILHRPSTSTEHLPLDMNVEALFQSPLTDICDLKLTLSPHLGQLSCHPL